MIINLSSVSRILSLTWCFSTLAVTNKSRTILNIYRTLSTVLHTSLASYADQKQISVHVEILRQLLHTSPLYCNHQEHTAMSQVLFLWLCFILPVCYTDQEHMQMYTGYLK